MWNNTIKLQNKIENQLGCFNIKKQGYTDY